MKKMRPFLFGCIILLMAVRAYGFINGEDANPQVPEPGMLLLLGAGLIVLVIVGIKKRKRTGTKGKSNP